MSKSNIEKDKFFLELIKRINAKKLVSDLISDFKVAM